MIVFSLSLKSVEVRRDKMAPKITLSMIWHSHKPLLVIIPALVIGHFFDVVERERLIRFRDKSALFGGQVKPGDPPSWP